MSNSLNPFLIWILTLKAPITTAADDKFCNISPNFWKKIRYDISWKLSASRQFSWNIVPYLLFLKKQQNLKLWSAAKCRWRFKGYLFAKVISRWEKLSLAHKVLTSVSTIFQQYHDNGPYFITQFLGSAVAQWYSAMLETEGPRVWPSPVSLCCVLEQEH